MPRPKARRCLIIYSPDPVRPVMRAMKRWNGDQSVNENRSRYSPSPPCGGGWGGGRAKRCEVGTSTSPPPPRGGGGGGGGVSRGDVRASMFAIAPGDPIPN